MHGFTILQIRVFVHKNNYYRIITTSSLKLQIIASIGLD